MTRLGVVAALGILASSRARGAETSIEGRLEGDTAWSGSRWTTEAHGPSFKLYWRSAAPAGSHLGFGPVPAWARASAGVALEGDLGELHAGNVAGSSRPGRGAERTVFTIAAAPDQPRIGASSRAQGMAWIAPRGWGHLAMARDPDGRARTSFAARFSGRGTRLGTNALLVGSDEGEITFSGRSGGIELCALGVRTVHETRAALGVGDRAGSAAFRATWRSAGRAQWIEVGLGTGVPQGTFAGSRVEVACSAPGAPAESRFRSARASMRVGRGAWRNALFGAMRRTPSGIVRASVEWSVTREHAGAGSITGSVGAERGQGAPSAVSFAWRGARRNVRWTGHAEISTRRGRVVDLGVEAGRQLRARIGLRVQDRAFERPRVGVEIGVSRAFGWPAAAAPDAGSIVPPD